MEPIEKKSTEDAVKWILGLVFSAGIATFQNWKGKRDQAKVYKEQIKEIHDIVKAQPAAVPPAEGEETPRADGAAPALADDLRTIVQRIQQQLTDHQSRGDERHAANIARFESIETGQHRAGEDLSDLRKYLRHNRGENRAMMKKILTKVSELHPIVPAKADEDEPCR